MGDIPKTLLLDTGQIQRYLSLLSCINHFHFIEKYESRVNILNKGYLETW